MKLKIVLPLIVLFNGIAGFLIGFGFNNLDQIRLLSAFSLIVGGAIIGFTTKLIIVKMEGIKK